MNNENDALFPAGRPGSGQPLENTYELVKRKTEELEKRRELEADAMGHGESANNIGYDPLPDLPYQDPYSEGWDDPQLTRKENKTKGAASGPYLTLPAGSPRSRSNESRNPARQLYSSTQGSSYSTDDPRRMFCLDPQVYGGEIQADTQWQSGKSDNQMTYDHACENAGYWTTNGGPFCNWRNFNITSGDGGGKPYKPATLEASTRNGQLTLLYNLGHGTTRATPEGYDMNIIGASGYVQPVADKQQNKDHQDVLGSMNIAHMYMMYRSDLTTEEFEQLADDIENSPIGDIHRAFDQEDPYQIFTDEALRKRLSKKIPHSQYREVYINVLAKIIGNATKRRSPDITAIMRLFRAGELTYLSAIEWFVHQCAHVVTDTAWFKNSGLDLDDLLGGAKWLADGEAHWQFLEVLQRNDFTPLINTYGKKPNKPGKPGGGNNNKPNRPGGSNSNHPWWRDAALAKHTIEHPTCKGPPCAHLGGGPDYDKDPNQRRKSWPEVLWEKWHSKNHPGCDGSWTVGNEKGTWCPHLPGGFQGSNDKDTWDRLSEKNKAKLWQKYHDFNYKTCPGKWEPQRSLFPQSGGYCWHHPGSQPYLPDGEDYLGVFDKDKIKDDLIDKDDRFQDIFDGRDNGNNIGSIHKPGQRPDNWKEAYKKWLDSLGDGKHHFGGKNGARLEVNKENGKTEIKFQNDKLNGKDRDIEISKGPDNDVSIKGKGEKNFEYQKGPDGNQQLTGDTGEVSRKENEKGEKETIIKLDDGNKHTVTEGDDGSIHLETVGPDDKKQTVSKDKDGNVVVESDLGKIEVGPDGEVSGEIGGPDGKTTINKGPDGKTELVNDKGDKATIETGPDGETDIKVDKGDGGKIEVQVDDNGAAKLEQEDADGKKTSIEKDEDGNVKAGNSDGAEAEIKQNEDGTGDLTAKNENGDELHIHQDATGGIEADIKNDRYDEIHIQADDDQIKIDVGDDVKIEQIKDEDGKIETIVDTGEGTGTIDRDGDKAEINIDREDKPNINANITNQNGEVIGEIHIDATDDRPSGTIGIETNQDGSGGLEFEGIPDWLFTPEGEQKVEDLKDKGLHVTTDDGKTNITWGPESEWPGGDDPDYPGLKPEWLPEDGIGSGPNLPEIDRPGDKIPDERPGDKIPEGGIPHKPIRPDQPGLSPHERLVEFIRLNGPIDAGNGNSIDVDDRGQITIGGNIQVDKDDIAHNNPNIDREDLDGPIQGPGGSTIIWDDFEGKITWIPEERPEIPDSWKDADYPGFHLNLKDPNSDKEINAWKDGDGNLIIDGKPAGDLNIQDGLVEEIKSLFESFRETLQENRPGLQLDDLSPENQKKWHDKKKEWQEKFNKIENIGEKIETIQKTYDWIMFLKNFGEVGIIIGIVVGGIKGLISIVGSAWGNFKSMDYLGELTVKKAFDECGDVFPNLARKEEKAKWTEFYPKYFNREINGISQITAQLLACRHNGYLIDCTTVGKGNTSISRVELSYLTPTHGIGLSASDSDYPFYRVLPRAYPDPGRRYGTANYDSNPRRGETTSLKIVRDHITTQAEWNDLASQNRSYWQPDFSQIIIGPDEQYDFKTQGGLTKKTGSLETTWSEVWRTSGFMNHDDCRGFYQQNIFTELGYGIFCDVNYRTDKTSHATWMELSTADPKPWPFKRSKGAIPKVTMDMEILQLNNGPSHQKTANYWQLAEVFLNFFDESGKRRAIQMWNYESQWENRARPQKGYSLHGGKIGDIGLREQFWHSSLEQQQAWGASGNTAHARCPLHFGPYDNKWKDWFTDNCTFIGFSISMWPQDQSLSAGGDGVAGVGGKSWKACLFKRLRFVESFPTSYHTTFPVETVEDLEW